ncbi:MAG: hypothetical protein LAO79_10090 [Acidobacteriia bacterium]|nr:hypothetical protein [Terriglobia bacterium]
MATSTPGKAVLAEPEPLPLSDPSLYIDRELSLLAFQRRVLEEAQDPENALLERVKFLSILFSNLDEFYMVRFAVLKQKVTATVVDGLINEQLDQIRTTVNELVADAYLTWRELSGSLTAAGVEIRDYSQLSVRERALMDTYFRQVVFPVLTPLAFDPGRPFPHISNLSLNLAVAVRDAKGVERFARVKVPDTLPQLVPVEQNSGGRPVLIWLEQMITENLATLFPGLEIIEAYPFRVTRDAEVEIQELESDDLLETIEEAIWQRRFRAVVRLNDCGNRSILGRGNQRRGSARAGAEVSQRIVPGLASGFQPARRIQETMREEVDVENVLTVRCLIFREKIEEQRTNPGFPQRLGDKLIARTQAAAAAAVGEEDNSDRVRWNNQLAFEPDGIGRYRDRVCH